MKFYEFVGRQVNRLSAHEEFSRRMNAEAKTEISSWIMDRLGEIGGDKREPEWADTEPGERCKRLIDEAMEFEECPGIVSLRALYARLWPPTARDSAQGCSYCDGTGFRTVFGEYGITAAYPCTHQPPVDADRRMGVRMSPSLARCYRAEYELAERVRRGIRATDIEAAVQENRANKLTRA